MSDLSQPIGVFDSGMGGLTVLKELQTVLPGESFIYLGDSARLPYGNKSARTVQQYALQASAELAKRGVKALVVACNTASAAALPQLMAQFAPLPVFGVIEPGAQAAADSASQGSVLVLATEGTVMDGAYQRALLAVNPKLAVHARACPLWVALAEQGYAEVSQESESVAQAVLAHALRGFNQQPITVLLGCTHFPVFRERLSGLLAANTLIVDSAQTTAKQVVAEMQRLELLSADTGEGDITFLATDGVERFCRVGAYFFGQAIDYAERVTL